MIVNESHSAPHTLIAHEDHEDGLTVEHPPTCTSEDHEWLGKVYLCQVQALIDAVGLDHFFVHKEDPDFAPSSAQPLNPGRYQVRAWFQEEETSMFDREYDEGMELMNEQA